MLRCKRCSNTWEPDSLARFPLSRCAADTLPFLGALVENQPRNSKRTQSKEVLEPITQSKVILRHHIASVSFWLVALKYQARCRLQPQDEGDRSASWLSRR